MDVDDYLARLRAEMENRLNGRLSGVNKTSLNLDNRQPLQSTSSQQSTSASLTDPKETVQEEQVPQPTGVAENLPHEVRYADDDISEEDPLTDYWGIIVTDSKILAEKYSCSQGDIYDLFNEFIGTSNTQQMYWSFLDIAHLKEEQNFSSWEDYNTAISNYIVQGNMRACAELHVFIIGGDDVIPIPMIEDPFSKDEYVLSDMCYAFEGNFLEEFINDEITNIEISQVRNNISRLPLEDGKIESDIHCDLEAYFNLSSMYSGGIPVGNVVMTSNSAWIPASTTMSQHLPLVCDTNDPKMTRNGMFISPALLTKNPEAVATFQQTLHHSDMLMFNLHGSSESGMSGFYSNNGEAFNIPMLRESNARVLNTVACFGARYNGYKRNDSMLLSSMYGAGILLYAGASKSVPMLRNNEARELLLNPGTGSEVFMRLYPLYQFKGMTAGKAMLQAKIDYFNMCRHVENDEFSLSTVLMFNLFGNPMLHVRKREHVIASALENDTIPPAPVKSSGVPFRKSTTNTLMKKDTQQSLLGQVRGAVDANLDLIRSTVEKSLYDQLGLPPRTLERIDSFQQTANNGDIESGYTFYYFDPDLFIAPYTRVDVDKQGNVKRIYTQK